MFPIKSLITLGFVAALAACANMSVPKVAAFGQYGIVYAQNKPFMQIDYKTVYECGRQTKAQVRLSAESVYPATREALASGALRFSCEEESLGNSLPYKGTVRNLLTDETGEILFLTVDGCKILANEYLKTSNRVNIDCPTDYRYLHFKSNEINNFEIEFEFRNQSECMSSQLRDSSTSCRTSSTSRNLRETGYIEYKNGEKIIFRISSKNSCRDYDLGSTINKKTPYKVYCDNLF